ncbi:ribonuclease P protein component [Evansella sp. AB-P1]|uniref:ribonuclease P protein component n=1 Tax=Evansella sp. AB-P1 TaxID=3037653 RepID=UPI00241D815E|nr:ribonuclease P protein component [Evansella sp. AB-P1]MDG5789404.1 ribonuclease P protein component [Evansella sp. AB-P1]
MKKLNRLKKNEEFQEVFQKGKSVANRQFVVYYLKKENQKNVRIGLSVSKKIGHAVMRNRIKRLIRESLRELMVNIMNDYDVVIIARKPTSQMELSQMKNSLSHVLHLSGVLQRDNRKHGKRHKEVNGK